MDTLEQIIATGLPGDAQPRFAFDATGRVAAVWNDLQGSDPRPSGEIRAKLFTGSLWGETHVLSLATGSNFQPAAAFDGSGHFIVCWMTNAAAPFTGVSQIAAFAAGYDIAFAVVDASTGSVSERGTIGIPLRAEFGVRVVNGTDGSVHLVFASSDGASFSGTNAHPVSFHHARWNGSSWEPLRTIAADVTNVVSASVAAASSSEAQVALVRDMDGSASTASDHEVFAARWNGTTWDSFARVTNDAVRDIGVQAGYRYNGMPVLIWARAAEIVGIHGSLGPVQSFLSVGDTASAEFHSAKLMRLPDGMVLTWGRAGSVFYSLSNSDGSVWTPSRMLPYTDAFERSISTFMTADGRVHVGFLRSTAASDSTLNAGSAIVVRSVDTVSTTTGANIDPTTIEVRNSFVLHDPYPNPFNPTTTIRYELPTESDVRIFVFDVLGRKVADLMEKRQSAGTQSARWDASHVPSGLYICRFEAVGSDGSVFAGSKKIILIK